jgi:small-conductance mechanosensitive channel
MNLSFLGNSLQQWGTALAITAAAAACMVVARAYVHRRVQAMSERTTNRVDDLLAKMLASTYLLFIFAGALYLGSTFLELGPKHQLLVTRVALTALLLQVAVWGDTFLRAWRNLVCARIEADSSRRASASVLCFITRLALWLIVILTILDNLGVNITTLVASLGIGGIAVALAVQNILGDLFASLSIVLDKPFEIGDFIIVGDVLGWVEHIGLKTTRVRGVGGEQVVLSNGDLLKSRIQNHKRMQTRRVSFKLRISYDTSEQKLGAIPEIVRAIVTAEPDITFERCHFVNYGEWSLDFEAVYLYLSPDFIAHLDAQQRIFLALYRHFEREGIQFAHPLSIVRMADAQRPASGRAPTAPAPGTVTPH